MPMLKRAGFWSFFGCYVFGAIASMGLAMPTAGAADKKIVVEGFEGTQSDKLRDLVKKALKGVDGVSVISDQKLASTEADLGLMQASDQYEEVAKKLGAAGFIKGKVSGKKKLTATVTLNDATGKKVGEETFKGANAKALLGDAENGLPAALTAMLAKVSGGAQEAPADKPKVAAKKDAPPVEAAVADEKPVEETEASEEPAAVAEDAAEESTGSDSGAGWTGLDVTAGVLVYNRVFEYNNLQPRAGGLQGYTLDAGPAVALAAEYYFHPNVGVAAGGDFTVAVSSKAEDGKGPSLSTASMMWYAGAKGKYNMDGLELNLLAAYSEHSFSVDPPGPTGDDGSGVSPVRYSHVRALAGLRYDLGAFAITAGGGYLHVLSAGKDDLLIDFPNATAKGTEGNVGVAIPLPWGGLEGRVALNARQYGLDFLPTSTNPKQNDIAGGAKDRYIGVNIGVGYRMKN
jgi:hypothetical protein